MKRRSVYSTLIQQFLRNELAAPERLLTPLFFGAVVLLLFAFTIPEPPPEMRIRMFVAQCLVSTFFALQIGLSRAFETESQDRVFDMIRTQPVDGVAFITAKFFHVLLVGGSTLIMTSVVSIIMQGQKLSLFADPVIMGMGVLMLAGLSGLGVLLSAVTLRAQARQILFPLLYFPLSTPVLIASAEGLCRWLEQPIWDETQRGWMIMLGAFDVIYITLTLLLGADAVTSD